ncbi:MAG: glycosyl hydrolase 115 family protein [Verrucomicrobiota bacterium]|jgi:hypothetical protein
MIAKINAIYSLLPTRYECLRRAKSWRHLRVMAWGKATGFSVLCLFAFLHNGFAIGQIQYVENVNRPGSFPIFEAKAYRPPFFPFFRRNILADIYVDTNDYAGVVRAVGDLRSDIARVTRFSPVITHNQTNLGKNVIIVGTVGKSRVIDLLIRTGKIDVSPIVNGPIIPGMRKVSSKWESFLIQVVPKPLPGVESGLVIAGSDKRGTIYGIYDLSEEMGVSPWYWWADVPVQHKNALFVRAGKYVQGPPAVKYRGIFLNDEAPDLSNWIMSKYGLAPQSQDPPVPPGVANYGRGFYTNLFEVMLRLKANYLWPAMWNNAFNEDDPENPRLANEYGIVMGTSHQEPMLRAQQEWDRRFWPTNWNYYVPSIDDPSNVLQEFWWDGIGRNKNYESIITIGMRGENDTRLLPNGTDAQNIDALTKIINVQRNIIAQEMNADVTKVPQLWCPYKEVLDYYNEGFRVPDDATVLWTDDNWGDIRRLPTADERPRSGGAGVYYHFDYHGGPRSYQWINTSPIAKVWDQMSLAKQYGADRIWIVNVGHFKGYEFPIEYFMNLAWNTDRWTNDNLKEYTRLWAKREFGPAHAPEIADIISKYAKYNGRRKPELLAPDTYSLVNYREAETVVADYNALAAQAETTGSELPPNMQDAFYELVLFPVKVCAQLNEMYFAAGRNALYARQGRASANDMAAQTLSLFQSQTNLMDYFNNTFANGKWSHFMDQAYIGYTNWQDPAFNSLQAITLTNLTVPDMAAMGVAVAGSEASWPGTPVAATLPEFDAFNQQRHYLDVFNKGKATFAFTATTSDPWIVLSSTSGTITNDQRLWVSVDWSKAPPGMANGTVVLDGANTNVTVQVEAFNPTNVTRISLSGFVEGEGFVSIEPEHYTTNTDAGSNRWIRIEDYGRTLSGMRATGPADAPAATPHMDSPCLEYRMYLFDTGQVDVTAITSPTLNFIAGRGLQYALSFDDETPQVVTAVPTNYVVAWTNDWQYTVADSARQVNSSFTLTNSGYHTLKFWMVDPGVVLQKLVVDLGGVKPSYLGPPESYYHNTN